MSKILYNQTALDIFIADTGILVPASPASYTIPPQNYLLWAASSDIIAPVGVIDIIVNDGSVDLNPSDGMDLIKGIFPRQIGVLSGDDFTEIGHSGDSLNVTVTSSPGGFAGVSNHIESNTVTTPGVSQTLITYVVPVLKVLSLHQVIVSCRMKGLATIYDGATIIGTIRSGASDLNPKFNWVRFREVVAGTTFSVDFLAAPGHPASDIDAYLDSSLADV